MIKSEVIKRNRTSGKIKVKFFLLTSIILSLVLTIVLNIILNVFL